MRLQYPRILLLCSSLLLEGCDREPAAPVVSKNSSLQPSTFQPTTYPPGRWRLAGDQALANVNLWVSHIVVRHREANGTPCFLLGRQAGDPTRVDRSREEALALIQNLREQLVRQPERFAELAAETSEDVMTRPLGGSFGGIQAFHFRPWPEVLDVLAQTPMGSISDVVESEYGFHVFLRRHPPPEVIVSGERLVVGHAEAPWLAQNAREGIPARTRADAWARASELYARARAKPEAFGDLLERHSEHADAVRSGDIGTWSTREITRHPREVEILSRLAVGEVAPPVDGPFGYEILRRTPNRDRQWFAVELVSLGFEPPSPGEKSASMAAAIAKIRTFSKEVQRRPTRFSELQREHCCTHRFQWQDGRGPAALIKAAEQLQLGEIAREPVRDGAAYVLVKRVEASISETPSVAFDLPAPRVPSVEPFIETHGGDSILGILSATTEAARASLGLSPNAIARLSEFQRQLGARLAELGPRGDRIAAYRSALAELSAALRPTDYARFESLLNTHWERHILQTN
jgi:hypothetical protein